MLRLRTFFFFVVSSRNILITTSKKNDLECTFSNRIVAEEVKGGQTANHLPLWILFSFSSSFVLLIERTSPPSTFFIIEDDFTVETSQRIHRPRSQYYLSFVSLLERLFFSFLFSRFSALFFYSPFIRYASEDLIYMCANKS